MLRPGGRVTVIDTDWGTSFTDALPNGRPGRRLHALLTGAGLQVADMHATTWLEPPECWLAAPLSLMLNVAAETAILTPAEAQCLRGQLSSAIEAGTLHLSVTMFGAYAHRPAAHRRCTEQL